MATTTRKKMTEGELVSIIDSHISSGATYSTKISQERSKALKYFNSEPYGVEKKGRSTYVSSEVLETISWALPQILKVFEQNEDVVKFDPISPESIQDAERATEFCHYVFRKQNPGFQILYTFVFDALLQKNAVVKVYFDKTKEYVREEYQNLTDIEVNIILQDENVIPLERETSETQVQGPIDPLTGLPSVQTNRTHNITVKRLKNAGAGKIKISNVPPEELIVSKQTRSLNLDDSPFVGHKVKKTISWLRSQGYKVPDDISDTEETNDNTDELQTRNGILGAFYTNEETENTNPASRLVNVVEAYIQVDYDNDGINEWRKVVKVGNTVFENEECYAQPFVSTSPMPIPHQFNGKSLADLVMDLQYLKSLVMRAMLDSFAFNINPAKAVNVNNIVDINDLLNTNPGHWIKIRGDTNNAILTLPSTGVGAEAFSLLEYVDNITESRSGVSRYTQGIDTNAFNKTATGTQAIMNASQEKIALITRIIAETGLGEIYKKIMKYASMFIKTEQLIQTGSVFVSVDPKKWLNLETITVNVGTGALDKQADTAQAQQILQMQTQLLQAGRPDLVAMVDAEKVFNAGSSIMKSFGRKNINDYFNDPKGPVYQSNMQAIMQSQQPPPPDPMIVATQIQAATSEKKAQQEAMLKSAEFELNIQKDQQNYELKKMELELKYQVELEKLKQAQAEQDLTLLQSDINEIGKLSANNITLDKNEMDAIHKSGFDQQQMINIEIMDQLNEMRNGVESIAKHINAPRKIIYDDKGDPIGVKPDIEDDK